MESPDPSILVIVATVLGTYALLAAVFLALGGLIKRWYPDATGSRLSATVHLIALLGFLIGILLAWMAYDSDHPMKERHLFLPLAFPVLAYGYIAILWLKGLGFAVMPSVLSSLFSKRGP